MTVNEYLKRGIKYEPEFYTVNELYNELEELIANGLGNYIVLITNPYENQDSNYVFLDKKTSLTGKDISSRCVYLDAVSEKEEEYLTNQIFGE